ncbi:putative concanavalin A-like lectin/glucanase domain-containing protein [Medicago truncatula]|nr:putative concanavalin A-like lectin/glucanase domain-containing protein [Medicago truncatula]
MLSLTIQYQNFSTMVFSSSYLPTQTLFYVLFLVFSMFIFLQSREGNAEWFDSNYSFDVKNFSEATTDNFTLQGDAQILPNGILELIGPTYPNVSQVLYSTSILIWDEYTGDTNSFVSVFSFVLKYNEYYNVWPGELVFFLVGENFEQDDLKYSHIGVDVYSRNRLKIVPSTRRSESLIEVVIRYDSSSKTLTVMTSDTHEFTEFHRVINLKDALPGMVKVGLSTGQMEGRETHDIHIHSWSFHSHFISSASMARGINVDTASYALLFFIYFMHDWLL